MPERFSDLNFNTGVIRLHNPQNLLENQGVKSEEKRRNKKGRRKKEDGLALISVKSIKEYLSKDNKSGYDSKGKRKLNIDEKEECKKIKVVISD